MLRENLLEQIHDDEVLVAPGVFDGLTANIVESLGFDAVYLGGYATGATTANTEPMLSAADMCQRISEITNTVSVPLIVDGNAGFGDAAHTYHSVKRLANAGATGIHIEDQVHPKRFHYHAGIKHVIEPDEMVEKLHAALEAKDDCDDEPVIIARTDAARDQRRQNETIEDAVERVNRYLDVGADVGMLFPSSESELRYAAEHVDGPIVFTMVEGREPTPTVNEFTDIGVDVVFYALSATIAVGQRIHDLYSTLQEEGETGLKMDEFSESQEFVEDVIGLPTYYDIEERVGKK